MKSNPLYFLLWHIYLRETASQMRGENVVWDRLDFVHRDWIIANCCDLMLVTSCWRDGIIVPVHTSSEMMLREGEDIIYFFKDYQEHKKK